MRVRDRVIGFPLRSYSLLGINNRDLRTFKTDLGTTLRMAELVEDRSILVSESGIQTNADIKKLAAVQRRLGGEGEATARSVALEAELARVTEEARRAGVRADAADQQATEATAQVKQSHGELYRRSEMLRQKIRTQTIVTRQRAKEANCTTCAEGACASPASTS